MIGKDEKKQVTEESWNSNDTIKLHKRNLIHDNYPIAVEETSQKNSTQGFIQEDMNAIKIITGTNNLDENENTNKVALIKDMLSEQNSKSGLIDAQLYESLKNERFRVATHFSNFESNTKKTDLSQSVDSLEEESLIGTVVKRSAFYESQSLELLDEAKNLSHHLRNKSMSACSSQIFSKSVDMLHKSCKAESLPRDSKRIDAQLKCYDEALRELAEEQKIKEDLLHKSVNSSSLPFSNFNRSISCNGKSVNQTLHVTLNLRATQKSDLTSNKDKSLSNSTKKPYNHMKKSSTLDVLSCNDSHQCKSDVCLNEASSLIENIPEITKVKDHKIKTELESQSSIRKRHNHFTDSSDKHKAYKKRSSSVGSKNKRKSVESTLKLYTSLEFPPPYTKVERFQNKDSSSWDKDTRVNKNSKKPKEQLVQCHVNKINKKYSIKDCMTFKDYEPLPCVKKLNRKEKFDSKLRKKEEESEVNRNMAGRPVSMCQQPKNKEQSKNQNIEGKDIVLDAKSDSDSEWSEQQLQNKRKIFSVMHGAIVDSEESNDEDPPFWLSKEGRFTRQNTVISNKNTCNSMET